MKTAYAKTDTPSVSMQDIMLLFQYQYNGSENAIINDMLSKAKRTFVDEHHTQKISQMHSTTYKDGWYKTYVRDYNGKRKEVVRKSMDELYEKLYEHYKFLDDSPKTFADVLELLADRKLNQLNRSPTTIMHDRRFFSYLDVKIKNKPISDITENDIRSWLKNDFMHRKPTESELRKMLQFLSQLFRLGIAKQLCMDNPVERISVDDYLKDCNLRKKTDEEKAFSEEEIEILRKNCRKDKDNPRALMALLASETGLRAGELSALRKSDIKDRFIHVHRQQIIDTSSGHQTFYDVEYTKDERKHPHDGRLVPITSGCREALHLIMELPGESEYLFHDEQGKPVAKTSYELNLKKRCRRLGFSITNNHAFRMAFNSRLINLGFSASERAQILGHAVETNERNYSLTDKRRLQNILERLNE